MSLKTFDISDYPSFYQSTDKASITAQKRYLLIIKLDLISMIGGSILTTFSLKDPSSQQNLNILASALIGLSVVLSLILKFRRYERTWYGGRAAAESIKSLTWKYITASKPFERNLAPEKVDPKFIDVLMEINSEKKDLALDLEDTTNPMLTKKMRDIRALPTQQRLDIYLRCRVNKQRIWYSEKAKANKKDSNKYAWFAITSQGTGFLFSLYLIKEPTFINLTGILSSVAVGLFSWMQIRKFQELSQSYTITANELGMTEAKSIIVQSDKELSGFVNDTESAISREHTMWIARREN